MVSTSVEQDPASGGTQCDSRANVAPLTDGVTIARWVTDYHPNAHGLAASIVDFCASVASISHLDRVIVTCNKRLPSFSLILLVNGYPGSLEEALAAGANEQLMLRNLRHNLWKSSRESCPVRCRLAASEEPGKDAKIAAALAPRGAVFVGSLYRG